MRITDVTSEEFKAMVMEFPANLQPVAPRSSGVHVSDIIRDIDNTLLHKGQRQKYDELSPQERLRMGAHTSMGWAWEEIVREALRRIRPVIGGVVPVGELTLDGVTGTPDGVYESEWAVDEFKATWRSSSRPLDPDFWSWLVQIKAYCKMLQTGKAYLSVFWVCGDYRESGPFTQQFLLEFSRMEVDDNWAMLVNHAKAKGWLEGKIKNGTQNRSKKR